MRYRRSMTGYATLTGPTGSVKEADTFTCGHCGTIKHVKIGCDPAELGGHCKVCDSLICGPCVARGRCDPIEKKLERVERSQDFHRWLAECA
jgi:hypothetical protein